MKTTVNDPDALLAYVARNPDNPNEHIKVIIRETAVEVIHYEVYVDGGLLGNGQESARFPQLNQAMARAQNEVDGYILGE